jgi:H+/Cl- antiporter ClcA
MTKNILYVLGVVLTAVGIIGFFNNPVFGLFLVDTPLNILHLATGILAIVFASLGSIPLSTVSNGGTETRSSLNTHRHYADTDNLYASIYAIVAGVLYGVLSIAGLVTRGDPISASKEVFGMVMNNADNILHIIIAVGFLYAGVAEYAEKTILKRS